MDYCTLSDMQRFCRILSQGKPSDCVMPNAACEHPIDWKSKKCWCRLFNIDVLDIIKDNVHVPEPAFVFRPGAQELYFKVKTSFEHSSMSLSDFKRLSGFEIK